MRDSRLWVKSGRGFYAVAGVPDVNQTGAEIVLPVRR
jgi:hypothetical protein